MKIVKAIEGTFNRGRVCDWKVYFYKFYELDIYLGALSVKL